MEIMKCPCCGVFGWSKYEIKNGRCPSCQKAEIFYCIHCHAFFEEECCCGDSDEDDQEEIEIPYNGRNNNNYPFEHEI
jgi:hypothetical protein